MVPAQEQTPGWPLYHLKAENAYRLDHRGARFGASGLLWSASGDLLTVHDREATVFRIDLLPGTNVANLTAIPDCFAPEQLARVAPTKRGYYDIEGLAQDKQGRLYLCEEANRWILRWDPSTKAVECLAIDWIPVQDSFSVDPNASFEGIAIGGGRLYVANERTNPLLIVVDLDTLKVTGQFIVWPRTVSAFGLLDYSDLSWFEGRLWVLCRHHRVVLEVDPQTRRVLAEYDYKRIEDALGYEKVLPTGIMEGLAVSRDTLWLVTDNNDLPRVADPNDRRPTLLKCPRPAPSRATR